MKNVHTKLQRTAGSQCSAVIPLVSNHWTLKALKFWIFLIVHNLKQKEKKNIVFSLIWICLNLQWDRWGGLSLAISISTAYVWHLTHFHSCHCQCKNQGSNSGDSYRAISWAELTPQAEGRLWYNAAVPGPSDLRCWTQHTHKSYLYCLVGVLLLYETATHLFELAQLIFAWLVKTLLTNVLKLPFLLQFWQYWWCYAVY